MAGDIPADSAHLIFVTHTRQAMTAKKRMGLVMVGICIVALVGMVGLLGIIGSLG